MHERSRKQDLNELAFHLVKHATEEADTEGMSEERLTSLAAAALGRRGGLKGGPARAKNLSAERRREIAKKAARARWKKHEQETQS
ncbi:MAG: hypothetical protein V3T83_04830 [Acidobacteriota bacterium]